MDRTDHATQAVIDQCIVLNEQGRTEEAQARLAAHRIAGETTRRVLRDPARRRRYINDYLSGF